ncbi:hypothetical protein P9X10_00710 [Bacillus cereus]|nr:hypothetical protein [Bacillus cereus]
MILEETTLKRIKDLKGQEVSFKDFVNKMKSHEGCPVELLRVKDAGLHPTVVRTVTTQKLARIDSHNDTWFKLNLEDEGNTFYYFQDITKRILQKGSTYYLILENNCYVEIKVGERECPSERLQTVIKEMKESLGVFSYTDTLSYSDFVEFLDDFEDYNYTTLSALDGNGNMVEGDIDEVVTSDSFVNLHIIHTNGDREIINFDKENIVTIVNITNSRNKYFMVYELDSITPLIFK